MAHYTYRDKNTTPPTLVFECDAPDILEADMLYQKATGKDPAKQPHVGCEITTP